MAAITICSDFGIPQNKVWHCFHCLPIYLPWNDGTGCHDLVFWMLSCKPTFSLSSLIFIKRLFSSSSLSIHIKVKVKSLSHVRPSATPWTAAFQAPPSMGLSGQEYWSGVPLPSPWLGLVLFKRGATSCGCMRIQQEGGCLQNKKGLLTRHWICLSLDLGLASLRTVRNKCCLSHPVCSIYYSSLN